GIKLWVRTLELASVGVLQIVRTGRCARVRARRRGVEREDARAGTGEGKHAIVCRGNYAVRIPVLRRPRVGHEAGDPPDVLFPAAILGCPDDIDPEVGIVDGRENALLSLLGTPQALAARWAHVH